MNKRLTLHHGLSHLLLIPALSPAALTLIKAICLATPPATEQALR